MKTISISKMKFKVPKQIVFQCLWSGLQTFPRNHNLALFKRSFSQWHVVGALCLEKKPVITQPFTPLEKKYLDLLQKIEIEKSYLSEHEKRDKDEKKVAVKLRKGEVEETEGITQQTAQDFEDACQEVFDKFVPAHRITDADLNNDRHSINRKLDSSLVFLVKQKIGNNFNWCLPQTIHREGETLRQTAERSLREVCSSPPKVQLIGNAPIGFYKYKYPKLVRGNGIIGAKVFFFKARLLFGGDNLQLSEDVADYLWLTRSELSEVLQPVYCKVVQSFLLQDSTDVSYTDELQLNSSENDEEEVPPMSNRL